MKDSSFDEALYFMLNEWMALNLIPHTLNIVTKAYMIVCGALNKWIPSKRLPPDHSGHLKVYSCYRNIIGLVPTFPILQVDFANK